MPSGKCKRTGAKRGGTKPHKVLVRKKFHARHFDQVWEDVRKPVAVVHDGKVGPMGTTARVELDEDVPGHGKNFCVTCSRYFVSPAALGTHEKTKEHRRRIKALEGPKPHNQGDADWAGGMGAPDNGPRREAAMAVDS